MRSTVYAPRGVIATSQPLASSAGLDVLQRGGNAIDAAVTAAAVLAVTEPHMTSMGGDVFAIVWSAKDNNLHGLNASGRSGALMTREALVSRGRTAITQGAEHLEAGRLPETTLYVTLEPCPMCVGAMILARIERLVFGAREAKPAPAVPSST